MIVILFLSFYQRVVPITGFAEKTENQYHFSSEDAEKLECLGFLSVQ